MRNLKKILYTTITFILLCSGCFPGKNKHVDENEPRFHTTDASELFFKNVRSAYYDLQDMETAKLRVYRFHDRITGDTIPTINLAIVENWSKDEAYVLMEPQGTLAKYDSINLTYFNPKTSQSGTLMVHLNNIDDQFRDASKIYQQIKSGAQWSFIVDDGTKMPLFPEEDSREAFRLTMFDFYRLVELL